jgi:hypothetical protein
VQFTILSSEGSSNVSSELPGTAGEKEASLVSAGKIGAYFAFNPKKAITMGTLQDKPYQFTQLALVNFH